jgi:hypothetical protein
MPIDGRARALGITQWSMCSGLSLIWNRNDPMCYLFMGVRCGFPLKRNTNSLFVQAKFLKNHTLTRTNRNKKISIGLTRMEFAFSSLYSRCTSTSFRID